MIACIALALLSEGPSPVPKHSQTAQSSRSSPSQLYSEMEKMFISPRPDCEIVHVPMADPM